MNDCGSNSDDGANFKKNGSGGNSNKFRNSRLARRNVANSDNNNAGNFNGNNLGRNSAGNSLGSHTTNDDDSTDDDNVSSNRTSSNNGKGGSFGNKHVGMNKSGSVYFYRPNITDDDQNMNSTGLGNASMGGNGLESTNLDNNTSLYSVDLGSNGKDTKDSNGHIMKDEEVNQKNLPNENHDEERENNSVLLYFVGGICIWGQVAVGLAMDYSAFLIPQLEVEAEERGEHLSVLHKSLIGSLSMIGTLITSVSCGVLADTFGRRRVLLALYVIKVVGFILPMINDVMWLLLLARVVQGISVSVGVALTYLGEIANGHLRMMLCCGLSVGICVGAIIGVAMGAGLHYFYISICGITISISTLILTYFFCPESPCWLYLRGQKEATVDALRRLHGKELDLERELAALEEMAKAARAGAGDSASKGEIAMFLAKFCRPEVYKPTMLLIFLMLLMAWSGGFVVMYYAVNIFKDLNVGGNEYIPAIIVNLVRALGAALGTVMLKKIDNRILLFWTSLVMCVCELLIGFLMHFPAEIREMWPESEFALLSVMPVVLVVVFMLAFGIGVGTVPITLIGVLPPPEAGAMVSGITMFSASVLIFTNLQAFPFLEQAIGTQGVYWLFAAVSFGMAVMAVKMIPRTRGLSRAQIAQHFKK